MALPKGDQYNEAVQNPRFSFADSELRSAKVETGMFDLPKPYSGGFTVTFKLQTPATNYAVRCFTRDLSDLQKRYQALSNFFTTRSSKYFVEAKYLQDGIKISGSFYPVIKMKWMEGEPLNFYLENNRYNKTKLQTLLSDFLDMVAELESLGIAHGDLQQGNIIVKNDRLFLIDYDGMYLPALSGLKSNELGHPNFQHPQRSANHFNEKIDRFSAIVIYLSLRALINKPTLWKYNNGENIILKNQDIADLKSSPVITELNSIAELKPLVERFIGICHLDFDKVPSLNEFISGGFTYDKSNVSKIVVKSSQYDVLDAKMKGTLLEHFGEKVEVIGFISDYKKGNTTFGSPYYFLNVGRYPGHTFTVTVWSGGISALTNAGKSPTSLVGKWFSAIGVITSYLGRPQMTIDMASQVQILGSEEEAKNRLRLKKTISANPSTLTPNASTPKSVLDKEAEVFGKLYQHTPVYTPPRPIAAKVPAKIAAPPKPIPPPPTPTYKTPTQATKPTTSSKSSSDSGCIVLIVCAIIGAIVIGAASDGKLWILGAIGGGVLGAWISTAFKS